MNRLIAKRLRELGMDSRAARRLLKSKAPSAVILVSLIRELIASGYWEYQDVYKDDQVKVSKR